MNDVRIYVVISLIYPLTFSYLTLVSVNMSYIYIKTFN